MRGLLAYGLLAGLTVGGVKLLAVFSEFLAQPVGVAASHVEAPPPPLEAPSALADVGENVVTRMPEIVIVSHVSRVRPAHHVERMVPCGEWAELQAGSGRVQPLCARKVK